MSVPAAAGPPPVPGHNGFDLGSVFKFCCALPLGRCVASRDGSRSAENSWMHGCSRENYQRQSVFIDRILPSR